MSIQSLYHLVAPPLMVNFIMAGRPKPALTATDTTAMLA
jgi:hypothetical protein